MSKRRLPLLVVDGYNVIYGTPAYAALVPANRATNPYTDADPMERAREALVADVAAYAQNAYEAVIVYDGANNLSPERPACKAAGVRIVFSRTGESADAVIEGIVQKARAEERKVTLVTSDLTVRASSGFGVSRISAAAIAREFAQLRVDTEHELETRTYDKMTLGSRLSPEMRKKLDELRGRRS